MPTLKASRLGIVRIKQARNQQGWSWSLDDDDTCLVKASQVVEPNLIWHSGGPYAKGISEGTWKRFLAGRQPISAPAFKAYCQVLELNWEEIVDRRIEGSVNTRQDWGEAIDTSIFYGRAMELEQLQEWIVVENSRLVAILGMGGIGKTALAVKLAEQIQPSFDCLIWRSLRHGTPVLDILADLLEFLSDGQIVELPKTINSRVSLIIDRLQEKRCLLLLDDFETVLRSGELAGNYKEGHQGYGELIRRVGEERHQSCLVVIGREKPIEISALAGATLPVRDLKLKGLGIEDAKQLLATKGFTHIKRGVEEFIQLYRGNPLALKLMATTIQEVFDGNILEFLEQSTLIIGDILPGILDQQFERLSDLEKEIAYYLAIENQPISLSELRLNMQFSVSSVSELLPALESLKRRSLLEKEPSSKRHEAVFTIEPVIAKYVTNQFIEQVCKDIWRTCQTPLTCKLGLLRSHALVNKQDRDEVKVLQIRLLLKRIVERLYMNVKGTNSLENQLKELLSILEADSPQAVGYGAANISNLLATIAGKLDLD
ncbi:MAG TPA: hypothetical protein DEG17_18535 [Cyanobacteria bacterium UBA11149]|nr:hypothetical protein [Cyanobacteria bacterium UBA11367]HBE60102.1 hypothetical protein [Cyanobacteria bacterium UBA11366]HBK62677.1 hypothetical protein [Cyanobacteria bacterium UBA11166]HBR73213.1 hypothetical protein [Cyanobacteria bacterium UBA11159]HBS71632.1 hypothetical protein [Cyanobacteria bacterium UBA11153]HBW90808.1 hypothetical protein [Cyanobacteria bacterium UBA11149]HCA97716.1 hypothetical protein [Cyanobacteria bacterium UBA9226]